MQPKGSLYWLFNNDKKPLYEDPSNGHVLEGDIDTLLKPDGQPAHLRKVPDGWKDALVKYGRNIDYWGVFRDFTVTMKFVNDGAKILRNSLWRYGMEVIIFLAIHKLNRTVFPPRYDPWYTGELDFSKFKQTKTNVSINVMEGGPSKYLKAFESTTYDIPIDTDDQRFNVYLDGVPFTNQVRYDIYENQDISGAFYYVGMTINTAEGSSQGVINQDQTYGITHPYPNDSWFMNDESKVIIAKLRGIINIHNNYNGNVLIRVEKTNLATPGIINYYIIHNSACVADFNYGFDITFDIPMVAGDRLYLKAFPHTTPSAVIWYSITGGSLLVEYDVKFDPSFVECLSPMHVFEKIVEKMTSGRFGVQSQFLQGINDIALTSGQAIRKWQASAVIKTSLKDFFQSFKGYGKKRMGIGLGVENDKLIIEELDYFFRSDVVFDLGNVDGVEYAIAEDIYFNTIKNGYKNQTIDKVNGRDEFNVEQIWTTPITRIVKELDLESMYRADMYGIEVTRIDLAGQDTTDNSADTDVFVISKNPDIETITDTQAYRLKRLPYSSVTGLLHPNDSFNIELSPKRQILNNGALLHSILDLQDMNSLVFQMGEKNSDMSTTLVGETITEKENQPIGALTAQLFKPYYASFTTSVPIDFNELMKAKPYSRISFFDTDKNVKVYAYLFDGGCKPETNDKQQWKMLLAPNNDLTKLI